MYIEYVYMHVYMCIHASRHKCTSVYACLSLSLCACVCLCLCVFVYTAGHQAGDAVEQGKEAHTNTHTCTCLLHD